jgi:hypothetical protein
MANFEINSLSISHQTVRATRSVPKVFDLYGPQTDDGSEVEVSVSPKLPGLVCRKQALKERRRRYEVICPRAARLTVSATVGGGEWDSFTLDVNAKSWYDFLTKEKRKFAEDMAAAARKIAASNDLPLSGIVACACSESLWGESEIFGKTGSPFNLQKPGDWLYPKCETLDLGTKNKVGSDAVKPASFCKAKSLEDAARLFSEWVLHYGESSKPPNTAGRDQLLKCRKDPKAFAEHLFLVGFADNNEAKTKEFGKLWEDFGLGKFD